MNLIAKVISWGTIAMSVLGIFGLLYEPEVNGWGLFAGVLFITVSSIAITYIAKDDEVQARAKELAVEQRIAAMVEGRMK